MGFFCGRRMLWLVLFDFVWGFSFVCFVWFGYFVCLGFFECVWFLRRPSKITLCVVYMLEQLHPSEGEQRRSLAV